MQKQKLLCMLVILSFVGSFNCATGKKAHTDRYHITTEEIATVHQADTAWEVIRYLRPNLLSRDTRRSAGTAAPVSALVYINGARIGHKDMLKTISNVGIIDIKYIDGLSAGGKYGTDSSGGVYLITVK